MQHVRLSNFVGLYVPKAQFSEYVVSISTVIGEVHYRSMSDVLSREF